MSKISWCDETWNPITGCTPVSPGCDNCYACRMATRLAGRFGYPESPNEFDVTFHPDKLDAPLRWRKPRVVFVCSMGDLFHEDVTFDQLFSVYDIMAMMREHVFLLLTKRPAGLAEFEEERTRLSYWQAYWPLPNVYLGVTVENQDQMWRVEQLLQIPAAKHWVSLEPLLGAVDIQPFLAGQRVSREAAFVGDGGVMSYWRPALAGVIVGGESGPGARPMHPDWARGIRDQCVEAGVPFMFKQWGEWAPEEAISENDRIVAGANDRWGTVDLDGRLWELTTPWTSIDLQTGEMTKDPEEVVIWRVGKKAAGRELDGQVWDEWPWEAM